MPTHSNVRWFVQKNVRWSCLKGSNSFPDLIRASSSLSCTPHTGTQLTASNRRRRRSRRPGRRGGYGAPSNSLTIQERTSVFPQQTRESKAVMAPASPTDTHALNSSSLNSVWHTRHQCDCLSRYSTALDYARTNASRHFRLRYGSGTAEEIKSFQSRPFRRAPIPDLAN